MVCAARARELDLIASVRPMGQREEMQNDVGTEPAGDAWRAAASEADIRNSYRLFLGRPVESLAALRSKRPMTVEGVVVELLSSSEFTQHFERPMLDHGQVDAWLFDGFPRERLLKWAADVLPLGAAGRRLPKAKTWREALVIVFDAPGFRRFLTSRPHLAHLHQFSKCIEDAKELPMARAPWKGAS